MARKSKKTCKVGGRGCAGFLRYLTGTIIPDTEEERGEDSGMTKDLRALAAFLRGADYATISGQRYSRKEFVAYLEDTLIPDLEENGNDGYAKDFEEGLEYLTQAGR